MEAAPSDRLSINGFLINAQEEERKLRTPEQRLCAAILSRALLDLLSDAILDFKGDYLPPCRIRKDAARWIFGKNAHQYNFEFCCRSCDLEPHLVRVHVKKMLTEKIRVSRGPKYFKIYQENTLDAPGNQGELNPSPVDTIPSLRNVKPREATQ